MPLIRAAPVLGLLPKLNPAAGRVRPGLLDPGDCMKPMNTSRKVTPAMIFIARARA